jgi:UDP-glucose 4-epimerase
MRVVVTGGAGFIGSNLVDHLLELGHWVVAVDNLSTGTRRFLEHAEAHDRFELVVLDLLEEPEVIPAVIDGSDAVVHLAANADVRFGWEHPSQDLEQNVVVTHHVLEAMRSTGTRRLVFASTGSIYGEADTIPTPENVAFPTQTSLYGASKLAAEGLVEAYAEGAEVRATILRFVSVLGPRYTHGLVVDFVRKLRDDPTRLEILGDGTQRKSYVEVGDCNAAIVSRLRADPFLEVYNLGVDDYCTVVDSAGWICRRLGVSPRLEFTGGDRGWVGDNPFIFLDTARIRATGWSPRYSIRAAVERTVDHLVAEPWILDRAERPAAERTP